MDIGDIRVGESKDVILKGVQVGQILRLSYTQPPGEAAPELTLQPQGDVIFRETNHETRDLPNGYVRHIVFFQVERIGV